MSTTTTAFESYSVAVKEWGILASQCSDADLLMVIGHAIKTRCKGVWKAIAGEMPVIGTCGYGEVKGEADAYLCPNNLMRDIDGRYLSNTEVAIIRLVIHADQADACNRSARGVIREWLVETTTGGNVNHPANSLLRGNGFPVCSVAAKEQAYEAVASAYQRLCEAWYQSQ